MPTNKNALIRYITIDKCLVNKKYPQDRTAEKIIEACNQALQESNGSSSKGISRRTFQKDLSDIESIWNVEIEHERIPIDDNYKATQRYSYKYSDPNFSILSSPLTDQQKKNLLEICHLFDLFSGLPQMTHLKEIAAELKLQIGQKKGTAIFSIENNPNLKGIEKVPTLAEHIQNKEIISIRVKPSGQDNVEIYNISPQYLKQYNRRWYLLAYTKNASSKKEELYTYPVDLIENITIPKINQEYYSEDINWDDYFSQFIGVTNILENEVFEIKLRIIGKKLCEILLNNKIHSTQELVDMKDDKSEMIITLKVKENWELINSLRKYAGSIEIIEPEFLRKKYRDYLQKGIEINS